MVWATKQLISLNLSAPHNATAHYCPIRPYNALLTEVYLGNDKRKRFPTAKENRSWNWMRICRTCRLWSSSVNLRSLHGWEDASNLACDSDNMELILFLLSYYRAAKVSLENNTMTVFAPQGHIHYIQWFISYTICLILLYLGCFLCCHSQCGRHVWLFWCGHGKVYHHRNQSFITRHTGTLKHKQCSLEVEKQKSLMSLLPPGHFNFLIFF